MSSILKALRKIEEEKRVANHAAPDLRMDQGDSAKKARPYLQLIAGIALGAVCVGLFTLWTAADTTDATGRLLEDPNIVISTPSQTFPSADDKNVAPSSIDTQVISSQEPVAAKTVVTEAVVTEAVVTEAVVTEAVVTEAAPVKSQPLPEGVFLKVSETFYHDDPANSMAVVNDLPVMIGTFVDSAVVLEIHSDKVVFEIDESPYDVPVSPLP